MTIRIRKITPTLWGLESNRYSTAVHRESKCTPGMRWNPNSRMWQGPIDAVVAAATRVRDSGVMLGDPIPRAPAVREADVAALKLPRTLRDYQKKGVAWLVQHAAEGALLADDMGLGKTRQALEAAAKIGGPAVIVCPAFVRHVWAREVKKWLGASWAIVDLEGRTKKRVSVNGAEVALDEMARLIHPAMCIYIINYDVVEAWLDELRGLAPRTVVFDECHMLQGERAKRSVACKELARIALHRIGLSGTPMTSRPRDLWNPIDTLRPATFGRPFDFYLRHADAQKETVGSGINQKVVWNTKGASNLEELRSRLEWFMLRRLKSDVAIELPPRTRQVVEVDVERKWKAPPASAFKSDEALRAALALAADGKLPRAVEFVGNHVESGSKVVVFTHRKAVAETIASQLRVAGIDAGVITGDYNQKQRLAVVDRQPTVICCTMDATAVGIDFSFADVAVFVELDWVPSKLAQAEARLHRFGQKRNVLIQYVIALGTADEVIREAVINKLVTFEAGVGKLDDRLRQDLAGETGNREQMTAQGLKSLFDQIVAQEKKARAKALAGEDDDT